MIISRVGNFENDVGYVPVVLLMWGVLLTFFPQTLSRGKSLSIHPILCLMSSWEGWNQSWHSRPAASFDENTGDDDLDYDTVDATTAGEQLFLMLSALKLQGTLSATQACLLAWWAMKSGALGPVCDIAVKPGRSSGQYSKLFDRAVGGGPNDKDFYNLALARRYRFDLSRSTEPMPTLPLHECLLEELLECPELNDALDEAVRDRALPPLYFDHEVVRACPVGMRVHPICIYVDAVAFDRQDSILGFWGYHMLSKRRHLLACIRKSEMCGCSCAGWCSVHPILTFVAWSLRTLVDGAQPSCKHDGSAFGSGDEARAAAASVPFGFKAICCLVKGDWGEMVHSLGLPAWNDSKSPCPMCLCRVEDLYTLEGFSPLEMPAGTKTQAHYLEACVKCEHHAVLDGDDLVRVRSALTYDNKSGGSKGRAILSDFGHLGLQRRDRLEMSEELPDVSTIDHIAAGPLTVTFWRRSAETFVRKRNPLFGPGTGTTIEHLACDWLHCLSLGVFRFWLGFLFWALVKADAWHINVPLANRLESSMCQLNDDLGQWYREEETQGRLHTRVPRFKASMLGPEASPELSAYGAQTNGILLFATSVLASRGAALGRSLRLYQRGLGSLVGILDLIRKHRTVMPHRQIQMFSDYAADHITVCHLLSVVMKPKHHMMLEMAVRLRRHGAPYWGGCWLDESDNSELKRVASAAHPAVFHARVLSAWSAAAETKRRRL